MPREDYLNIDVSKVIADIGNNWISEDDLKIKKDTIGYKISIAIKGTKISEEHKTKISAAHKGKKLSIDHVSKIIKANTGCKMPENVKNMLKEHASKRKNVPLTEEHRLKVIKTLNNNKIGHFVSDETRIKQSIARKGRKITEETREKYRLAGLNRKDSEETKLKKSLALKGRKRPPEVIAKMIATKALNKALRQKSHE